MTLWEEIGLASFSLIPPLLFSHFPCISLNLSFFVVSEGGGPGNQNPLAMPWAEVLTTFGC